MEKWGNSHECNVMDDALHRISRVLVDRCCPSQSQTRGKQAKYQECLTGVLVVKRGSVLSMRGIPRLVLKTNYWWNTSFGWCTNDLSPWFKLKRHLNVTSPLWASIGHHESPIETWTEGYRTSSLERYCYAGFLFPNTHQTKDQAAVQNMPQVSLGRWEPTFALCWEPPLYISLGAEEEIYPSPHTASDRPGAVVRCVPHVVLRSGHVPQIDLVKRTNKGVGGLSCWPAGSEPLSKGDPATPCQYFSRW